MVAIFSMALLTFINELKSTNDMTAAIDMTIVTMLVICVIFFLFELISYRAEMTTLHPSYYTYVIICSHSNLNWLRLLEFFMYLIIVICVMDSLQTFDDACIRNIEECHALWKLWHRIFFSNN